MFDAEKNAVEVSLAEFYQRHHLPDPRPIAWNTIPTPGAWGLATSFFAAAAAEARAGSGPKLPVPQRAQELAAAAAEALGTPSGFARVEAVKGYLNLYFDSAAYAQQVVDTVLAQGADFGRGQPQGERIMIEYAQPNTHHSFHIGHARNALLGETLARIVEFAGFDTIRASYPGDIGLGVITVVWAYLKFYRGQEPEGVHERGQWLLQLYVEASNLLGEKPDETPAEKAQREAYDAERRALYRRWDEGDPEVRAVWEMTRAWSLAELRAILAMLDIDIDVWFYESQLDEPAKEIVEELIRLDIAEDERPTGGAVIVKIDEKLGLKKEKYRSNILLRSDGTTLYLTKDLALARQKFEQYHVDRSVYVVDVRQSLHLQQAFKILELWGFPQAAKCFHLGYGFVSLPEGAMSARKGRLVLFKDVADEARRRVLEVIAEKNPNLPLAERQAVADQVGLGALTYAMLSIDNNRDMVFDLNDALSFDGHTGPYIQNAHVRATSILRKADGAPDAAAFTYDLTAPEITLIDLLGRFPATVALAAAEYRPLQIANYAYELATAFHSFYHSTPVLAAETPAIIAARLRLVAAARQTLANALRLLVIGAPDAM
jgi:arginyl-tRNA synthetase